MKPSAPSNRYIPKFASIVGKDATDLRLLFTRFYDLNDEVQGIKSTSLPADQTARLQAIARQVQLPAVADTQLNPGSALAGVSGITFENISGSGIVLQGTYANRPAAAASTPGSIFYATDQDVYYQFVSGAWKYAWGVMRGTINPNQKPALVAADAGFLFFDTLYQHTYRWDGAAWGYAPGDDGSGYVRLCAVAPRTGVWQLCDGTANIKESLGNGTDALVGFTGLAAGTMPTWNNGTYPKMAAAVTGLTVAAGGASANNNIALTPTGAPSATTQVDNTLAGSTVQVGSATHTHTVPDPHTHAIGTLDMQHGDLLPYYRL